MRYVIAQPCQCGDHANDEGYMYLANEGGAIKFDSIKEAQDLIDDFAKHEGLCEEHKKIMTVIPECEVISDGTH
ncbi:uncharacterized protein METZ01_LOCUS355032 [marine metagenome]|uniref:Uncharacterized protein n=1 Tax=marine metagenome TaxID=408172 RepID=A0A382RZ22_9ZZZZ